MSVVRTFLFAVVAVLVPCVIVGLGRAGASAQETAGGAGGHPPVVLVHGYNNKLAGCQGIDVASYWRPAVTELTRRGGVKAADVVPVSFYACDTGGVDMTGYGPDTSYPLVTTRAGAKLRAGRTNHSSIVDVARDFAWFVHHHYAVKGVPVQAVGHSMGGLIIREALRRVSLGDPAFPPALDVTTVLTMSTPHTGWAQDCKSNTQCVEMTPGSDFLAGLAEDPAPQGRGGTQWWAMGSQDRPSSKGVALCDFIPQASATAVAGIPLVYAMPCYRHNGYLSDQRPARDATGSAVMEGRHSLAMMSYALR